MRTQWTGWVGIVIGLSVGVASSAGRASATDFPPIVQLQDLGANGLILDGIDFADESGCSVAGIGDINGDGIDDILIGARGADPSGKSSAGECYVIFGATSGLPTTLDLAALDGSNGFVLEGGAADDAAGNSVSGGGDIDGDGLADLIIGAPGASPGGRLVAGQAHVLFGSDSGFPASVDLSTLDGTNGFAIHGIDSLDLCGSDVFLDADVNGDGLSDVMLSAPFASPGGNNQAGETYVVFGTAAGFPHSFELSSLDGTNGFVLNGVVEQDRSGRLGAADVNGDGVDDILIGATGSDPGGRSAAGASYVVFGSTSAFPASIELASLDGTNGFTLNGIDEGDSSGAVSGAGDVNGDGLEDILIGALGGDHDDGDRAGEAYVVFGSTSAFPVTLELSELDGTNGFVAYATQDDGAAGISTSAAGDVNGDGLGDILIAAGVAGRAYLVFGSLAFPASLDLSALDGTNGYRFQGIESDDSSGVQVSSAGDFNGDGTLDVLLGGPESTAGGDSFAGKTFVAYSFACMAGRVNAGNGFVVDSLYVNGSTGAPDATVEVTEDALIDVTLLKPIAGGNGKFVLHANIGVPDITTQSELPFDLGSSCFEFLLPSGASPLIVANNIGKANAVGASSYYGVPTDDPDPATTNMLYPALPVGTVLTLQALVIDPASIGTKGVSVTNAVVVQVVP